MLTRSPTLRLALPLLGVQTPPAQVTFLVLALEIVIAACAAVASPHVNAPIHMSVRAGICVAPPGTMAMTLQRRNRPIRSRVRRCFGKKLARRRPRDTKEEV